MDSPNDLKLGHSPDPCEYVLAEVSDVPDAQTLQSCFKDDIILPYISKLKKSLEIVIHRLSYFDLKDILEKQFPNPAIDLGYSPVRPTPLAVSMYGYGEAQSRCREEFEKRVRNVKPKIAAKFFNSFLTHKDLTGRHTIDVPHAKVLEENVYQLEEGISPEPTYTGRSIIACCTPDRTIKGQNDGDTVPICSIWRFDSWIFVVESDGSVIDKCSHPFTSNDFMFDLGHVRIPKNLRIGQKVLVENENSYTFIHFLALEAEPLSLCNLLSKPDDALTGLRYVLPWEGGFLVAFDPGQLPLHSLSSIYQPVLVGCQIGIYISAVSGIGVLKRAVDEGAACEDKDVARCFTNFASTQALEMHLSRSIII